MPVRPSLRYVILGAGRQGTAAGYDLAIFGDAAEIMLCDVNVDAARRSAERINRLVGRQVAHGHTLDVTHHRALVDALRGANAALSAVPYTFNLAITHAAIEAGVHLCDMGGNTDVVKAQLALTERAREAGISVLPDCGMGPGMVNVLAVYSMTLLDETREVWVYDGGLPQNPQPPWNYQLTFHVNGLTNEYDGKVSLIRDGQIVEVDALSEYELVDLSPLGTFEAFVAAGGSTAPWTFEGLLDRFETRIIRYPGHFGQFRAFKDLGLFSQQPIQVGNQMVIPREVFHALLEPRIVAPHIRDVCYIRGKGIGRKDGKDTTVIVDLVDRYDEQTGFTGMERLTGWHCAIMMGFQAQGSVPPGARPLERLLLDKTPSAEAVMAEVARRGIGFEVRYE